MIPPEPDVSALTNYQTEIYLHGLAGTHPTLPTDLTRLEGLTQEKLDGGPYGYVAGAAGKANARAFQHRRKLQR